MPDDTDDTHTGFSTPRRKLTPAAARALAEAEERRKAFASENPESEKESGGRDGPEPVRYGDWEKDGLTSDF